MHKQLGDWRRFAERATHRTLSISTQASLDFQLFEFAGKAYESAFLRGLDVRVRCEMGGVKHSGTRFCYIYTYHNGGCERPSRP